MALVEPRLRPQWLRLTAIVGLGLLITVVVWWPMFRNYPKTPIEDGHAFLHMIEAAKASVKIHHEAPLWNPFDCRGLPLWDHPENITASPIFFFTLPFSAGITVIVWSVVHVVVGFLGMWLLCRDDLRLSRGATMVAASMWAFGATHNQYAGEHMAFFSFYTAPLLLFAWRKAEKSWSWAVGTGLIVAWMVYDGATYPLPLTIVFLGIETVTRFSSPSRALNIAARAAVVGVVGLTVGASRILPLQGQFASHVRVMEDDFDNLARFQTWVDMYLLRTANWRGRVEGQQYVFGEYQAYIGILGVILFFVGLLVAANEGWWLGVVMLVLVILMLGHFAKWAPWTVLHAHVPPFKSMRVPARFRLLLAMPIAAYVAYAIDRAPTVFQRATGSPSIGNAVRVAVLGMGLFAAGDSAGLFTQILEFRFMDAPPVAVTRSTRFYYGGSDLSSDVANQPRQNHAWLGCRTSWAFNGTAPVWTGDVPQARAKDDGAVVEVGNRTQNTFTIDANVSRPSRILLNSGYDAGWRTDVGTVVAEGDLLALDVPPGQHKIHVKYWPKNFTLGIILSLVGAVLSLAFLLRKDIKELLRPPAKV